MIGQVIDLWMQEIENITKEFEDQRTRLAAILQKDPTTTNPDDPMNTMNFIHAYRVPTDRKFWCFDDARFGLSQELFMHGASDFITDIVGEECERAELIFSTIHFPTANCILRRTWSGERVKEGGCEYYAQSPVVKYPANPDQKTIERAEVWLCPAMTHYFGGDVAPEFIFGQITPSKVAA